MKKSRFITFEKQVPYKLNSIKGIGGDEGQVILTALIIMMLITLIGFSAVKNSHFDLTIATNDRINKRNFCYAESALNEGYQRLINDIESQNLTLNTFPETITDESDVDCDRTLADCTGTGAVTYTISNLAPAKGFSAKVGTGDASQVYSVDINGTYTGKKIDRNGFVEMTAGATVDFSQ